MVLPYVLCSSSMAGCSATSDAASVESAKGTGCVLWRRVACPNLSCQRQSLTRYELLRPQYQHPGLYFILVRMPVLIRQSC